MEENKINNLAENNVNVAKIEKEIVEDKSGKAHLDEAALLQERKEKVIKFLKTRYNWLTYIGLAIIVYIAVKIRTRNLPLLKDITTGTWTLGPDLDPFFFLRLAQYIVENGKLFAIDTMRYVPIGFNMQGEYILHPYLIAWFHKIAVIFGSESVTHSAILYPVFMFALTVIAFFFFTKGIFIKQLGKANASIIALISSFFLSVTPVLLPRTIAGIPEKESAAFLFMFLTFYFFLSAWQSKKNLGKYGFSILAAISTAIMASIWGGFMFIFLSIAPAMFIAFLLGKVKKDQFFIYGSWLFLSFILMIIYRGFSPTGLITSTTTAPSVIVLFIMTTHFVISRTKLKNYFSYKWIKNIPPRIVSLIIAIALILVATMFLFGPFFVIHITGDIKNALIQPATSRLIQTVAENRQPFFTEWASSFGPYIKNIPIFFWLFFIGSVYLFYKMIFVLKKNEKIILTLAYVVFLTAIIFSRYSPNSTFNGTNFISLAFYAGGFIAFVVVLGYYYYKYYVLEKEEQLKNIDIGFILIFALFVLSIVAARSAVRTVMMLVPPASIIISYFVVASFNDARKAKEDTKRIIVLVGAIIITIATIFAGYQFYNQVNAEAGGYAPSIYTQQWQKAMAWVRENTTKDAVFGHWWDYGYWLQSIGERATVLDGGNAVSYWNHLMGRYALTGNSDRDALEFLYTHNTTHFLIDSTDIGKYTAFSSIGSDKNYDRRSWLTTFLKDNNQIRETKNSTVFLYSGGTILDGDIIYDNNGSRIFLPAGRAGIGAVLIEKNSAGEIVSQPIGIYIYQNNQFRLPLRYAFANGKFIDYEEGVEAGVFVFPYVDQTKIDLDGAMLYLSDRTVKSQLARLYLYKEDNPYFKLVHSEDDFVVAQIKAQNPNISDIVFFNGVRGPIRIWEINYPDDIEFKDKYLSTEYPKEIAIA